MNRVRRTAIARFCYAGAVAPERAAMVVAGAGAQSPLHTYSWTFNAFT